MPSNLESEILDQVAGFHHEPVQYYFKDFIELHVKSPSNDFSDSFYLDVCATVGEYHLTVEAPEGALTRMFRPGNRRPHDFKVRLLQCKLRYQLGDCSIPPPSKYRYSVQAGALNIEVQERFKAGTGLKARGRFKTGPVGPTVGGSIEGTASASETDETATRIKPEIAVVEHHPWGWTIGHGSLGDPLQATSNYCLNGSYFIHKVKDYDHTCRVEFVRGCCFAQMTFQISARDAFYVERVESGVSKQSAGDEKARVIEEMRRRIAGLVFEKLCKSNEAFVVDNDELVLARISATAHRGEAQSSISHSSVIKKTPSRRRVKARSSDHAGRNSKSEK